jgi:hypothetical protein
MDDALRLFLLFIHLVAFAVTLAAVFIEDLRMAASRFARPDARRLQITARIVLGGFCVLAATGLSLVAIDTGFDRTIMLSKPKLMAKLSVVLVLLANGLVLYLYAFPALWRKAARPVRIPFTLCVLGGVNSASWFYASFLGIAKTLVISYTGFMALYALIVCGAVGASLLISWRHLAKVLSTDRPQASSRAAPQLVIQ